MLTHFAYRLRPWVPARLSRLMYRLGRFLYRDQAYPSLEATLTSLRRRGFTADRVIDVGAYRGDWTRLCLSVFPAARVLMVEAQSARQHDLQRLCATAPDRLFYAQALLGAADGPVVEFAAMATGSSVFHENSGYPRELQSRPLTTLDRLLEQHRDFEQADLLKLDVQGYELEVLKGASRLLTRTDLVLLEASWIEVNRGCPLIAEVMYFMARKGFRPLDICSQIRRTDGTLWQTDLLFARRDSRWLPVPEFRELL